MDIFLKVYRFKGTVSRDFLLIVFSWISSPPPHPRVFHLDRLDHYLSPVSTTSAANLPPFVDTGGKIAARINDTSGKFATGISDTGGKFLHHFCLCCWYRWQFCHRCQRCQRQICRRCCWHRWQIMATKSGCRHLKVNLKAKIYICVYSTTQWCPNKIIKIFLLEGFFHLPPVSLTPVANFELRISPRIFEKIRNDPNGIIRGLGETVSRKKPEAKNLVTLSL